jgi:hypothetical protein
LVKILWHDGVGMSLYVDPHAWLADVLGRIADHKSADLGALLPWNWSRVPGVGYAG